MSQLFLNGPAAPQPVASGLGSNVSIWLGPPSRNNMIAFVSLGGLAPAARRNEGKVRPNVEIAPAWRNARRFSPLAESRRIIARLGERELTLSNTDYRSRHGGSTKLRTSQPYPITKAFSQAIAISSGNIIISEIQKPLVGLPVASLVSPGTPPLLMRLFDRSSHCKRFKVWRFRQHPYQRRVYSIGQRCSNWSIPQRPAIGAAGVSRHQSGTAHRRTCWICITTYSAEVATAG
jgi:hypothetical protein